MAEITDTRSRIIDVARVLFADHGYEGASIRDIAKAAEVNVASVNYHFTNKENLIKEILRSGYRQCSEEMRAFYEQKHPNLEETLLHLFRHFLSKSHDLISSFKMVMSAHHTHLLMAEGTEDVQVGPPGGRVVMEALAKEVAGEVSEADLVWAMRCLYDHITHTVIIQSCVFRHNALPYTSIPELEAGLIRLTNIIVKDLKSKAVSR